MAGVQKSFRVVAYLQNHVWAGGTGPGTPAVDVKTLHAKIGELTLENDFLGGALNKAGLLSAKR